MSSAFQNNLNDLPTDVSTFIFSEAQRKLECVNRDSDLLDKKSFTLITVLLAISGLLASFLINSYPFVEVNISSYTILIFGFIISLSLLVKSVLAKLYYGDSFSPSQILNVDEYYLKNKDALIKGFLISWYDSAIKDNLNENKKRGSYLNIASIISMVSLMLFIGLQIYQIDFVWSGGGTVGSSGDGVGLGAG